LTTTVKGIGTSMKKSHKVWIFLGLSALVLRHFAGQYPDLTERWYSRGFFPFLRQIWDFAAGWLPFAWLYIFLAILIFGVLRLVFRKRESSTGMLHRIRNWAFSILSFLGAVIFLFLFLWGFNYYRVPFETQVGLHPQPLSGADLEEEMAWSTALLLRARAKVPISSDSAIGREALPTDLEAHLHHQVTTWLRQKGFPTPGKVRGRVLYPKGVLMVFSTAGIYFPFTGEGHIDGGLHHLQWAPVMAHELSHGYGFGDEGVCNFIAFAACVNSPDPVVAYAARLSYWRTVGAQFRRLYPEDFQQIRDNLPAGIQADLTAIRQNTLAYPDILPQVRDAAYNSYLRAQGVKEGMLSYDRVTMLVRASREE
jgi:hypothetical protein